MKPYLSPSENHSLVHLPMEQHIVIITQLIFLLLITVCNDRPYTHRCIRCPRSHLDDLTQVIIPNLCHLQKIKGYSCTDGSLNVQLFNSRFCPLFFTHKTHSHPFGVNMQNNNVTI